LSSLPDKVYHKLQGC